MLSAGNAGNRKDGVKAGEEILVNYGKGFWEGRQVMGKFRKDFEMRAYASLLTPGRRPCSTADLKQSRLLMLLWRLDSEQYLSPLSKPCYSVLEPQRSRSCIYAVLAFLDN